MSKITQTQIDNHFEIQRCEHWGDRDQWFFRAVDTQKKQVYEAWFDDENFPASSNRETITTEIHRLLKLEDRKAEKIYITPTIPQ